MKRFLIFLWTSILFFPVLNGQVISVFPYLEDFESFPTCGTACGTVCGLSNGWQNPPNPVDHTDWLTNAGPTPTFGTGPSVDHTKGNSSGKYLYTESSYSGCQNATASLITPWLNFSSVPSPAIDFWYHGFGVNAGTFHLDIDTSGTGAWITDLIPPIQVNEDAWKFVRTTLYAFGGKDSVRIRIRGITGNGQYSDLGLDDIRIYNEPPEDVGIVGLDSLDRTCGFGSAETIIAGIKNFGSSLLPAGTAVPATYVLNGTPVSETLILPAPLAPEDTVWIAFATKADLSVLQLHQLQAWTSHPGDTLETANDTFQTDVRHQPLISNFPYAETFENGDGYWYTGGYLSSWEQGIPNNVFIQGSHLCGSKSWVTGLTGKYNNSEYSFLESPCFDFSAFSVDPTLRFSLLFITESCCDEGWMEMSVDRGQSWAKLGSAGSGMNWYNDVLNQWWDYNSGTAGQWAFAEQTLAGAAGKGAVKLRFYFSADGSVNDEGFGIDNIFIFENLNDASVTKLLSPESGCGLSASETVTIEVSNNGQDTIFSLPVCFRLNGGITVCDTIQDTIPPSDKTLWTFSQTADLSLSGIHQLEVYTNFQADYIHCNDTLKTIISHTPPVASFPYLQKFDIGKANWESYGTVNSWAMGSPAKQVISGAASGNNAWVTGGLSTATYYNSENSWVLSPCFDLTQMDSGSWLAMKIWWENEFSFDGANIQYSLDSGNTWQLLGKYGDGDNWYTDNSINAAPGGFTAGWSGGNGFTIPGSNGWVIARHALDDSLRMEPNVRFRVFFASDNSVTRDGFAFDDFAIAKPLQVNLGPDTTVCGGYQVDASGPGFVNYLWQDGSSASSLILYNPTSIPDTVLVVVAAVDTFGLESVDSTVVVVLPTPFNQMKDTILFCRGDTLNISADSAGLKYAWSTGDSTAVTSVTAEGKVYLTLQDSAGGCSFTDSTYVAWSPEVALGPDTMACLPDTFIIYSGISGAGSWLWSTGQTTQNIGVTATGSYSVTVTDSLGCISADTVQVTFDSSPNASFAYSVNNQTVNFVDLSSANTTQWVWDFGDLQNGTGSNPSHTYNTNGTYTVQLIASNFCGTDSFTQVILITADEPGQEISSPVKVWPNPAGRELHVLADSGPARFILVDMNGRVVQRGATEAGVEKILNVENLPVGLYVLSIRTEGAVKSYKIHIER